MSSTVSFSVSVADLYRIQTNGKPYKHTWSEKHEVEALIVPTDLAAEFEANPNANAFYLSLSKSAKKMILSWLVLAKTNETRQKRIIEIVESAHQNLKPKHMR